MKGNYSGLSCTTPYLIRSLRYSHLYSFVQFKMMHYVFLAFLLFALPVLGYSGLNSYPPQWTSEIQLQSLAEISARLKSQNPGEMNYLNHGKQATVRSCDDYFKFIESGFHPENNAEIAAESYFIKQCLPLRYLQQAQPAKISYLREFNLQKDFGRLPAAMIMPSLSGDDPKGSLKTAYPDVELNQQLVKDSHLKTTVGLQSKQANLIAIVSILAWGDFNHDGYDDLLLFVANYPYNWQGTFHSYQVHLVSQKTKNGAIEEICREKDKHRVLNLN